MVVVKNILIIGGTGTLGRELLRQLKYHNITVLSRDEHKQQAMKRDWPCTKFVLGDIRDKSSIAKHFIGKDLVFHVAALKHVDHLESNPIESLKTNVLGTINVAECCVENDVKFCVFSSTDKAVDPINTYGFCKALSEKILFDFNNQQSITRFSVYRWGNVVGSNGSAIPFFVDCLKKGKPVPVTHANMTRFWIKIEDAVSYVLSTYENAKLDSAMIHPKMKATSVIEIIDNLRKMLGLKGFEVDYIGLRPGEKIHESLRSQHSPQPIDSSIANCYTPDELDDLLKEVL